MLILQVPVRRCPLCGGVEDEKHILLQCKESEKNGGKHGQKATGGI
jgi:hypothetical protein